MNRSLMEKTRSMLSGAGLGQEFWALAVDTACYLKNRSPTSTLVDKTPYEVWSGQKPSFAHPTEKCIFVGYKDGIKGYKLWNHVTRKIVYNRDAVFREVKNTSRNEVEPKEKGLVEFELKNEGSDSF